MTDDSIEKQGLYTSQDIRVIRFIVVTSIADLKGVEQ
jgi:hypothetical protein